MQKELIRDTHLNIDLYENFLTVQESSELFNQIENNCKWSSEFVNWRRSGQSYGDPGIVYSVNIFGKTISKTVIDWKRLKCLIPIRDKISALTGCKCNVCYIQRYPCGKVGIKPHRDKEMTHGTSICGLSLGQTRVLSMLKYPNKKTDINLPPGSLYVLNPPTNDYWAHSIEKDESKGVRISLTFRDYSPPSSELPKFVSQPEGQRFSKKMILHKTIQDFPTIDMSFCSAISKFEKMLSGEKIKRSELNSFLSWMKEQEKLRKKFRIVIEYGIESYIVKEFDKEFNTIEEAQDKLLEVYMDFHSLKITDEEDKITIGEFRRFISSVGKTGDDFDYLDLTKKSYLFDVTLGENNLDVDDHNNFIKCFIRPI